MQQALNIANILSVQRTCRRKFVLTLGWTVTGSFVPRDDNGPRRRINVAIGPGSPQQGGHCQVHVGFAAQDLAYYASRYFNPGG